VGAAAADAWRLTVHLPLGSSHRASVFLVSEDRPGGRLLRLKRWREPAAEGFLERFHLLRDRLASWRDGGIIRPLAAWLDDERRPAVLSEFVQGVPIVQAVTSGAVEGAQVLELIHPLRDTLRAAHAEGLTHGSLVSGNVVVQPRTGAAHLLDFGMAAVCSPGSEHTASVSSDRHHLAALLRTIRGSRG
jgi:tRNA A-37 threonylcarbamoyl transferase component Bud32